MYKAINYWVFGGFEGVKSPYEFIDWASSKKLDGVELTVGDALSLDITQTECLKIAKYAESKNIGLRTLASGIGWSKFLTSNNVDEQNEAINNTKKMLQIASWIGAETILTVIGATRVAWDPSRPVQSYKSAWNNGVKAVNKLIEYAEKYDVNLAFENVWNRFLISPMEWKIFLDQFESKKVGMYFDVANACLNGRPQDYPELLGDRIKAVHLKNFEESDSAGGLHGFGDDLFKGVVDFKAVFESLDAINYNGPFTVEMIPFSRLPNMILPDQKLADKVVDQLLKL